MLSDREQPIGKSFFRAIATPLPDEGVSFIGVKDEFVPDQDLDLVEIFERFTRGEQLDIGREGSYSEGFDDEENPLNVDLEKLATADLTERDEYAEKLKELQQRYIDQEKDRERQATLKAESLAKRKMEKRIEMEIERKRSRINEAVQATK